MPFVFNYGSFYLYSYNIIIYFMIHRIFSLDHTMWHFPQIEFSVIFMLILGLVNQCERDF
jgi:hypothetical protein